MARAIRLRVAASSRCPRLRLRFRGPLLRRVPCAAWTPPAGPACLTQPLYDSPPPPGRLTLRAPLRFVQKPSILRAFWRRVGAIDLRSKIKPRCRRSKAIQSKGCWPLSVWPADVPSRPAEIQDRRRVFWWARASPSLRSPFTAAGTAQFLEVRKCGPF